MIHYKRALVLCLGSFSTEPGRAPGRHIAPLALERKVYVRSRVMKNFWKLQALSLFFTFFQLIFLSPCWLRPAWLWMPIRSSSSGFPTHLFSPELHLKKLNSCYYYPSSQCPVLQIFKTNPVPSHFPYSFLSLEPFLSILHWLVAIYACESEGCPVWG